MNIAIILSGGTGSRLGGEIPKQYIKVNDKMIVTRCVEVFERCEVVDMIWVVASKEWRESILDERKPETTKIKGFSEAGETRQLSIWNALIELESQKNIALSADDIIIIHDAARPNVTEELINSVIDATKHHDGGIPVLPMKDTVYLSEDGQTITNLLERSHVMAGQAPEAFKFGKYIGANRILFPKQIYNINGSTEPAILAGMDIAVVPGDEDNYKITTQTDLERYRKDIHF